MCGAEPAPGKQAALPHADQRDLTGTGSPGDLRDQQADCTVPENRHRTTQRDLRLPHRMDNDRQRFEQRPFFKG